MASTLTSPVLQTTGATFSRMNKPLSFASLAPRAAATDSSQHCPRLMLLCFLYYLTPQTGETGPVQYKQGGPDLILDYRSVM